MYLSENHFIKHSDPRYTLIDNLCSKSKNLYNASLYDIRQHYFNTGKHKTHYQVINEFRHNNNPDFRALPSKVAQEVCMQVGNNFKSFFASKEKDKKIPKYLNKQGRNTLRFNKQTISKSKDCHNGIYTYTLCKKDLNIQFKSKIEDIQFVEIHKKGTGYNIKVVYKVETLDTPDLQNLLSGNIASIDLGVNNLVTLVFTNASPIIFNGLPIKSTNQYYNKRLASLKRKLGEGVKSSHRIERLTQKRNHKVLNELHKTSRMVVNHLVSNNTSLLIIGYNEGWKQDINIGSVNNQKFVQIPFRQLVELIRYKCELAGIAVVLTEESYTSKTSFLDREEVCKHDHYVGQRVKRGCFKTSTGAKINADVNGAYNIMRKVVPDENIYSKGIEGFVVNPLRHTISQN